MKIIMVRNKDGNYPHSWRPLHIKNKIFWLGGQANVVLVKDAREAQKVMYRAKKSMNRFNLIYYTVNVEKWKDSKIKK